MAICSHCRSTIFSRASRHAVQGPHHTDISHWRASVANACAVCTLLLQHLVAAIKDALAQKTASAPWTPPDKEANRERDDAVRNRAPEDLLLDELDTLTKYIRNGLRDDDLLPVYECSVQDAGGRKAWILKFQPRNGVQIRRQDEILELEIKPQKFFVYDANYDQTRKSCWAVSESNGPLASRTDSDETFKQINRWTDICEKTHEHCRPLFETPGDDAYVPKRLLDVGTLEFPCLKLVETDNKRVADFRPYITLSYKWGYEADYVLEKSTRERYINEGLPENELPVTFREAVQATRRLGKKYLWIDALCMLQKDADEWLEECPKMQQVYGNSFLSLAAVSADNYVQGLFRTRRSDGLPPSSVTVRWEQQTTTCCLVREDLWRGEVLSEPLFTRGWVLQERLLAPRILHFQRRQVFWQCPTLTACEGAPGGLSEVVTDERLEELRWRQLLHREKTVELDADQKTDMHETWRFAVQSYTSCNLTKSSDKLMAIASMASRMKEVFNEGYFAGLWERRFVEQLAWRVVDFRMPSLDPAYRAPSWSWASVDSIVSLPERIRYERVYTMTVPKNGINMVLEKPETVTGTLHFASLTAETELHKLAFSSSHDAHQTGKPWSWAFDSGQQRNEWCQFFPDKLWSEESSDLDLDEVDISQHPSDSRCKVVKFTAAMLAYSEDLGSAYNEAGPSYSGIAIALGRARAGRAKVYCRVGLIEFRSVGGKAWEDMRAARVSTSRKEGEVAASDKRDRYIHVITLL